MSVVLLTGSSGQLGRVVHQYLLAAGHMVIPADRDVVDVTSDVSVGDFISNIENLDAVVHLVGGISAGASIADIADTVVRQQFDANVLSAMNIFRHTWPLLVRSGNGAIVTIGARDVLHPQRNRAVYASSKGALVHLTQALAEDGRDVGIRANVILPSIIRTEANLEWASDGEDANWIRPENIAATIAFLISPECRISGASLPMYERIPY